MTSVGSTDASPWQPQSNPANKSVNIILAHMGGFNLTEALAFKQLERYPEYGRNVWFDFSSIARLYADSPFSDQLVWVCHQLGTDRLLFGSDYPLMSLVDAVKVTEKFAGVLRVVTS